MYKERRRKQNEAKLRRSKGPTNLCKTAAERGNNDRCYFLPSGRDGPKGVFFAPACLEPRISGGLLLPLPLLRRHWPTCMGTHPKDRSVDARLLACLVSVWCL